jgi:glycerol-3-phosphate cytidylyltransferase
MHAGHMIMLTDAKLNACDKLIVGVQSNPALDRPDTKNTPIQSYEERIIMVTGCKWVDDIVKYDTEQDLYDLLVNLKPDVRILGTDYVNMPFTGDDLNIEIYYHKRDHNWSTSNLRNSVYIAEYARRITT